MEKRIIILIFSTLIGCHKSYCYKEQDNRLDAGNCECNGADTITEETDTETESETSENPDDLMECPKVSPVFCDEKPDWYTPELRYVSSSLAGEGATFDTVAWAGTRSVFYSYHKFDVGLIGTRPNVNARELFFLVANIGPARNESVPYTVTPLTNLGESADIVDVAFGPTFTWTAIIRDNNTPYLAQSSASSESEDSFVKMPEGTLLKDLNPKALEIISDDIFVVGDGMVQFGLYGWRTRVAPGSGEPFNALDGRPTSGDDPFVVAVGDGGRIVTVVNRVVTEVYSGIEEDLLDVAVLDISSPHHQGEYWAVGRQGHLVIGSETNQLICKVTDDAIINVDYFLDVNMMNASIYIVLVTESGNVFTLAPDFKTLCQSTPLPEVPLDVRFLVCADSPNPSYLIENGLYGGATAGCSNTD